MSVAIELARAIGRMPAHLLVIGIEAAQTAWGSPPSPSVDAAIDVVVDLVTDHVADRSADTRIVEPQPAENVAN